MTVDEALGIAIWTLPSKEDCEPGCGEDAVMARNILIAHRKERAEDRALMEKVAYGIVEAQVEYGKHGDGRKLVEDVGALSHAILMALSPSTLTERAKEPK